MTACLQCFWMFPQIGFASNRNLVSSFGKTSQPFCTDILWAKLRYFLKLSKFGTWFPDFSDFRPNKMCVGAQWRFLLVFYVQYFTDLFTILKMFHKLSLMLHKSWSYIPSRQYGTSPFFKTSLKKNIFERGIGKIRIFLN